MVNDFEVIHMGGRTYNPHLGRFMQADPFVQAPGNLQNYNRYSYVLNNPMSYTDPSGYFFKKLGKFVKQYWRPIVAAIATVVTYGAASGWVSTWGATWGTAATASSAATLTWAGGAAAGAMAGFVGGAVATGSLRGAMKGAFSGAVFGGIGSAGWGVETTLGAHAVAGGVLSDLQGGNFGHGFWTAGIMKVAGMFNSPALGANMSEIAGRATIQAMVGGTLSRATGGKFANGAISATIQYVVNASSEAIHDTWGDFVDASKRFFSTIARGVRASVFGLASSLTGSTPKWVYLYRVVGEKELAQILGSGGQFQLNPDSGWPEKQFWMSVKDARWYANTDFTHRQESSNTLSILETRVSRETFSLGVQFLDAGHPAVSFSAETLPFVNKDVLRYGINLRESVPVRK